MSTSTSKKGLETTYKKKSLDEIEKLISSFDSESKTSRMYFIMALYYLQFTGRYTEDSIYKDLDFYSYLESKYYIRPTTFRNEVWAYTRYSKECSTYGKGLLIKIRDRCGPLAIPRVLKELKALKPKGKVKSGWKVAKWEIEHIIESNLSEEYLKRSDAPSKPDHRVVEKQLDEVRLKAQEYVQMIKERDERIAKLEESVRLYKVKATAWEEKYMTLVGAFSPVMDHIQGPSPLQREI